MEILLFGAVLILAITGMIAVSTFIYRRSEGRTKSPAAVLRNVDQLSHDTDFDAQWRELRERAQKLKRQDRDLKLREHELQQEHERLVTRTRQHERALERVAGMSAQQAKQELLRELQDQAEHENAKLFRELEEETKRNAEKRAQSIISTAMYRLAMSHVAKTTVAVVELPFEEMKGRIIGKEGRNIRVLELLTGADFIVDETPNTVIVSSFDGVRREIARETLERLVQDGRIHPASIEETYNQVVSEFDQKLVDAGEQALLSANVQSVDPKVVKLLGRLSFRTSYSQNVLAHSVECANLAALMARELGVDVRVARRAALLHDIGKALSHEIEGPHAVVGAEFAARHGEVDAVTHAIEAHHNEVRPQTVEAVLVQVADALSGGRPGARGETMESYVKRLRQLEKIAGNHDGVDKVFAVQAGRELRVIVQPDEINDNQAAVIANQIAREIEQELDYPGHIKVTVIRESRATEFAK